MPPKTREEVRHNLLVTLFTGKIEEEYENTRAIPDSWWTDDEARFLLRNYTQHNFTEDERGRASAEAIERFNAWYYANPMTLAQDIITDIIQNLQSVFYWGTREGPGHGKGPPDKGGARELHYID